MVFGRFLAMIRMNIAFVADTKYLKAYYRIIWFWAMADITLIYLVIEWKESKKKYNPRKILRFNEDFGGEAGIRTPAPVSRPTPLAGAPLIATWVLLQANKNDEHILLFTTSFRSVLRKNDRHLWPTWTFGCLPESLQTRWNQCSARIPKSTM